MTEDGDFPGEDFPQIISKRYNDLTKSEKRIADYIRKNQDECAFLSAGELAARLDLSQLSCHAGNIATCVSQPGDPFSPAAGQVGGIA